MENRDRVEISPGVERIAGEEGRYLYCVADAGERVSLGEIGLEGKEVYTIPYFGISALVHDCPAQPLESEDQEVVRAWVMAHHRVVEAAWERWSTVLPLAFDTIIKGERGSGAEERVRDWLKQEYEGLKRKMEKVRGKAEYGVQVFWDPWVVAASLTPISLERSRLEEEIRTKPRGLAYLYRQRLEKLLKREMETKAEESFKDFYSCIRKYTDDIRVERAKKLEHSLPMLMNLSCLVPTDRYSQLGEELERINRRGGFSVRFTGPWPPYSFVGGASSRL